METIVTILIVSCLYNISIMSCFQQITIEANDKELQRLQEQLASLRSDKESLEALMFDTQSHLEQSEVKKEQLEHDVQELLVKQVRTGCRSR